jgi:SH3 domain-containing YSC84-like protein 1
MRHRSLSILTAFPFVAAAFGMVASVQAQQPDTTAAASGHDARYARDAQGRVNAAINVVETMKQDPDLARLLRESRGVFLIPRYGKAGLVVGAQGGAGVVLSRQEGKWSDPAFFDVGGASIGAQAGGEKGAVAMLLMTDRALDKFESSKGKWSLDANAGLTVVRYSRDERAQAGRGDVMVWSEAKGLYGGLTAGVTDITPSNRLDHAYYQQRVDAHEILTASVNNPAADPLREALATHVASTR